MSRASRLPRGLEAIAEYYEDFGRASDADVIRLDADVIRLLLARARERRTALEHADPHDRPRASADAR